MVYQISTSLDAYAYWMKHGHVLEGIVDAGDFSPEQLPEVMAGTKILREVHENYLRNLSPEHKRTVNKAEKAIDVALKRIKAEKGALSSLEGAIRTDITRWSGKLLKPETQLQDLLQKCETYGQTKELYSELFPSEPVSSLGSFYQEIGNLSELLSPTSYTAIVSKYASSSTKEELQQAQQSLGKNVWQKVEAEKERLLQKYSGKLSKAEAEFLKALPGKKWRELDAEMSKVVAHAEGYLGKRREIEKETLLVQSEIKRLADLSLNFSPESLAKLTHQGLANRVFDDNGTIYLRERVCIYQQEIQEMEKVRSERRKVLEGKLVTELGKLQTAFEREEKLDISRVDSYECKVGELGQHYRQLGVDLTEVSQFGETLERVKSYLPICSPVNKLEVISGETTVKVVANVVTPISVSVALPTPVVQPEVKPETESTFPEINCPLELTKFAFDYRHQAGDKHLAKLCRQVAGLGDKDEMLPVGFSERLGRIDWQELANIALSGKDREAYQLLKSGVEKYAYSLM